MKKENEQSYYVTDRSFNLLRKFLNLSDEVIRSIPENGRVLEVGSGVHRNFAEGLSSLRPDLKVLSVDPTLGISKSDFLSIVKRDDAGEITSVYYTNKIIHNKRDYLVSGSSEDTGKVLEERLRSRTHGEVVALAPDLPFKENSFDLIIDSFGPGFYLHEDRGAKEFQRYLIEIFRILKHGGEARIFPVIKTDERHINLDDLRKKSLIYYENIFKNIGLNVEIVFESIDSNPPETLMVIKKR